MKALWEYGRNEPVPFALLAHLPCVRVACQEHGTCLCDAYGLRRRVMPGFAYELSTIGSTPVWIRAGWRASRGGKVSKAVRARVLARDNNRCQFCGATENLEIDHIVPVSRGGKHNETNLRVLCQPCNRAKWHHHDEVSV